MRYTYSIYLYIIIVFTNCSNSILSKRVENSNLIIGNWIVQEIDFNTTEEEFVHDNEINFYTFFGSSVWANSKGKRFEFNEDGLLTTNLISKEKSDKIKLNFKYDETLSIKAETKIDSSIYEMKIVVDKLNHDIMIWKLSNYMSVKLKKE